MEVKVEEEEEEEAVSELAVQEQISFHETFIHRVSVVKVETE